MKKLLILALLFWGCDDKGETKSRFIGEWNLIDVNCAQIKYCLLYVCGGDFDEIENLTFNDNHTYKWDTYSKVVTDSIVHTGIGTWYVTNYDDVRDSLFLTEDTTKYSFGYTFTESLDDNNSHYILKLYWQTCQTDTFIPKD